MTRVEPSFVTESVGLACEKSSFEKCALSCTSCMPRFLAFGIADAGDVGTTNLRCLVAAHVLWPTERKSPLA